MVTQVVAPTRLLFFPKLRCIEEELYHYQRLNIYIYKESLPYR